MKKILVCYDFSDHCVKALQVAVDWAVKMGSSIDLVHVDDQLAYAGLYADIYTPGFEDNARKFRQEHFDKKTSELISSFKDTGVKIDSHLVLGDPVRELLSFAKISNTDLIVTGSKGVNIFSTFLIGSIAWKLMSTTHLPLLCVKKDMVNIPKNIVYSAELTKDETRTLEVLKSITDVFSPHLEIGHVIGPDTNLVIEGDIPATNDGNKNLNKKIELAHHKALFNINALVGKWNFNDASTFVIDTLHDSIGKTLLKKVKSLDSDLVVIGSHAKNFWERIVLGSTSEYILKRSDKSFLIIPNEIKE